MNDENKSFLALRNSLASYAPISDETWEALRGISKFRALPKNTLLYSAGNIPQTYAYVYQGLIRCFACDANGNEYNKNFFDEGMFPGAMTALLTASPSMLSFETIENSFLIEINFLSYRKLMIEKSDLKLFQIYYLEKNWLLAKDSREIEIVQDDATARYLRFIDKNPTLINRLAQYHIASHLGITPTQLSRIRKGLKSINLCK